MSDKLDKKDAFLQSSGQPSGLPNEHLVGLAEALFEKYCRESFAPKPGVPAQDVYIERPEFDGPLDDTELLARMRNLRASLSGMGYELPSLDEPSDKTPIVPADCGSKYLQ